MLVKRLIYPVKIALEITERCPHNCIFCEPASAKSFLKYPARRIELNTKDIFVILEKLAGSGVCSIFLTGGEPCLRHDLPDIVDKCHKLDIDSAISSAGGVFFTKEYAKNLKYAGLRVIQFSVEGFGNVHDSIVGVKNSFNQVIDNIKTALDNGLHVNVSTVAMKSNYKFIVDLFKLLVDLQVNSYKVLRLMAFRQELLTEILSKDEFMWLRDKLIDQANKCQKPQLIGIGHIPGDLPQKIGDDAHALSNYCPAAKTEMTILCDGTAVPCVSLQELEGGNILSDSVLNIWNSPNFIHVGSITPDKYEGTCALCDEKDFCYSCRAIAKHLTGNIFGSDISCSKCRS